ncbi:MAG: hypothetical protein AAGF71_01810 [Pseudomonadota bacterium]
MRSLILILTFVAVQANAAPQAIPTCPPPMQFNEQRSALLEELRQTKHRAAGTYLTKRLATLWSTAPNKRAEGLLKAGVDMRSMGDFDGSEVALDALVDYCPTFAEGYHQRALTHWRRGDNTAALMDVNQALEHDPEHLAGLTLKIHLLHGLGRHAEAHAQKEKLTAITPWMPEFDPTPKTDGVEV